MELSRRRLMQAAGVIAAGAAMDVGLPAIARASTPPIALTGTPTIYSGWSKVKLPGTTAMQCFGFNSSTVYTCQNDGGDPSAALTFTRYLSPTDTSHKMNVLSTSSHGGQVGSNGPTIWTPCGDGSQITRGDFDASSTIFTADPPMSPGLGGALKVNVDTSSLVLRDSSSMAWLYSLSAVKSAGTGPFPAPLASPFQIPTKSGTVVNIGHDVTGNWLYYATQTDAQKASAQFTVGYYNFIDGTTTQTPHNFPTISGSSYELEGLAILPDASKWVVGVNNGPISGAGSGKTFSLVTVS